MNKAIEIIDGVAYAVEVSESRFNSCNQCAIHKKEECANARWCLLDRKNYYRYLTSKEREEVTKALGRGME